MDKKLFIFLALFSALIQAGQNNVRVLTSDRQETNITQEQFNRFQIFQDMAEDLGDSFSEISLTETEITLQAFKDLLDLTALQEEQEIKTQLEQFELARILNIIKAGIFLNPNHEWLQFKLGGNNSIMDYLVNKFDNLEYVSSVDQFVNFLEENADIKLQFIEAFRKIKGEYFPVGQLLENVLEVIWNPKGNSYFLKFLNRRLLENTGWVFNAKGQPVGFEIGDVNNLFWDPQGNYYFVKFNDFSGELISFDGQKKGFLLQDVATVFWNPQGTDYFVKDYKFNNNNQLFSIEGQQIGNIIQSANSITWNLQGTHYFTIFGDKAKLFSANNQQLGNELNQVVNIYWNPQGNNCFIKFKNNSVQLLNIETQQIEREHQDVYNIIWNSQGTHYLVVTVNGNLRLFSADGQQLGNELNDVMNIYWNPQGIGYFVKFFNHRIQLFTINDELENNRFQDDVKKVYWNPQGTSYIVKFLDNRIQLFTIDGKAVGEELQRVDDIFWNSLGTSYIVKFHNTDVQLYSKLTDDEIWARLMETTFKNITSLNVRAKEIQEREQARQEEYARKGMAGKALQTLKNWWNNEF